MGNTLYLAGIITDSVKLEPYPNGLGNGDAVEIALDGLADGTQKPPRSDDHDLLLSPGGILRDYGVYPTGSARAVAATGGGWAFEIELPYGVHGAGPLSSGKQIGLTWGLIDRDSGTTWDTILTTSKRSGRF